MQIGREPDCCVPAMRDELDAMFLRHPCDTTLLADAAHLGHVWLDDIEGTCFEEGLKSLAPREHLAAADGHGRVLAELGEVFERVGRERFFKPMHIVVSQHLRGVERPLVAVGPVRITAARIDHELVVRAHGFACRFYNGLIGGGIATTKRPPADLEGTKALRLHLQQMIAKLLRLIHEQGCVGLHALTIATAEQPSDWLSRCFAKQIPQGDVDATDRVGNRSSTSEPEHVLMQFLANALGFECILAAIQRLQHSQRSPHECVIGEHASEPYGSFIGMDGNECVDAIFRPQLIGPAAFGSSTAQACAADFTDFHGCRWKSLAWGWKMTLASSGNIGRAHLVWPRLMSLALVEPGASTST